jgi:hypothetical protein
MTTPTTFTVGENTFHLSRLPVKKSLRGLKLVGSVLLPAMAEAHNAPAGQVGAAFERAIGALDCLPELLDLFVDHCTVVRPNTSGAPTALKPFVENVFSGHPSHTIEFLVRASQNEYADFLGAQGMLGQLLAGAPKAESPSNSPST